jgi:hypothetical protein
MRVIERKLPKGHFLLKYSDNVSVSEVKQLNEIVGRRGVYGVYWQSKALNGKYGGLFVPTLDKEKVIAIMKMMPGSEEVFNFTTEEFETYGSHWDWYDWIGILFGYIRIKSEVNDYLNSVWTLTPEQEAETFEDICYLWGISNDPENPGAHLHIAYPTPKVITSITQ